MTSEWLGEVFEGDSAEMCAYCILLSHYVPDIKVVVGAVPLLAPVCPFWLLSSPI
jgi:hypothetical protein